MHSIVLDSLLGSEAAGEMLGNLRAGGEAE